MDVVSDGKEERSTWYSFPKPEVSVLFSSAVNNLENTESDVVPSVLLYMENIELSVPSMLCVIVL